MDAQIDEAAERVKFEAEYAEISRLYKLLPPELAATVRQTQYKFYRSSDGITYFSNTVEATFQCWLAAKRAVLSEAKPVDTTAYFWLVELRPACEEPATFPATYYVGYVLRPLTAAQTQDPYQAARFTHKADAELVASKLPYTLSCIWTAVEHGFAAPPAAETKPVATIRFERSKPGAENDMPRVVSCDWLPDGVYPVYLAPPAAEAKDSEDVLDANRYRWINDQGATFSTDDGVTHHVCEWAMNSVIDKALAKKGGE